MGVCAEPPALVMGYAKLGNLYDALHNQQITFSNQRK